MNFAPKINILIVMAGILVIVPAIKNCEPENQGNGTPNSQIHFTDFPSFITPSEKYFDVRSDGIPDIDPDSYRLKISGAIKEPVTLSLEELRNLEMDEKTVTIECIGNPAGGKLIGTAKWKGFGVYDLLKSIGIKDEASIVIYHCADGYSTYNTLEELQNRNVMGALFMNGIPIPTLYGFPLRIIFPGYYGVRQPGWVVEMELMAGGGENPSDRYKTDSSIAIDSKIFFPVNNESYTSGESIKIGGTAYGGKRVAKVEITGDNGNTWIAANITDTLDQDYVWIFWEIEYTPPLTGTITICARATAQDGRVQPREDSDIFDGINSWPTVTIYVE